MLENGQMLKICLAWLHSYSMISVFGKNKMPKKAKEDKPKVKNLFDHINEIRVGKNPDYFSTLSDEDIKTWSNYMVCRVLSMQPELVESINELQYYQDKLSPEQFYRLCIVVVPYGKKYCPYVKRKGEKYNKALLTLLSVHFQDSIRNILEYISILPNSEMRNIVSKYGYSEKQIEELFES